MPNKFLQSLNRLATIDRSGQTNFRYFNIIHTVKSRVPGEFQALYQLSFSSATVHLRTNNLRVAPIPINRLRPGGIVTCGHVPHG